MEKPKLEATAFHKWLFQVTGGNPVAIANELVKQVINYRNPQVFELMDATGDKEYTADTMIKAAKLVCDLCGEHSPNYYIPKEPQS